MMAPSRRLLGLAAVAMLPAAAVAGFSPRVAPECLAVLALCIAAAVYDAVGGNRRVHAIRLSAPEVLRFTKDVAAVLPVTVDNQSGAAAPIRLAAAIPASVTLDQSVKEAVVVAGRSRLEWTCTAHTRGDHRIGTLHLETPSPFGLWMARASTTIGCTLRVYPNLRDRATCGLFLRTANVGLRVHRQIGKGREFENLRQYIPGDSFEDIHWKATARRGSPAVKLYRVEHAQELYAVIDASRLSAREGILESYVDAALHLALVAERQGDRFGLVTFSDRTQRFIRARSSMDHFRLCREAIYNLRAGRVSPDFRDVFTNLQLNLRRRSLLVFFTSLDDALLAENFERDIPLLARRHLVLVNVTRAAGMKPLFSGEALENLDAVYAGLAGQMLWNRMRRLKIALQNRGVKLAVVDPERIKLEVTSQYLDVKRRQAL
jgi:uncharacterized protein (DUF58 family)